jgi:hypothetical protein
MAVCVCDPWCCNVEWDEFCATDGVGESECGANFQCGSLCRECEDGDVTWVDPTVGIIDPLVGWVDARQPHPVDNATTLQGLSAITVYAPGGADIVDCWTLCETNQNPAMHPPGLPANDIAGIADNGDGTFTLTLDRAIMPGEVTELTYTSTSGTTVSSCRFIAHPADVDVDETSAPADILAVINSLNGVIPLPDNLVDLDRDGEAAPADILRVIDLLNGAGAFEVWLDVTVDHDAPCP